MKSFLRSLVIGDIKDSAIAECWRLTLAPKVWFRASSQPRVEVTQSAVSKKFGRGSQIVVWQDGRSWCPIPPGARRKCGEFL
jgi:hypothetical protein